MRHRGIKFSWAAPRNESCNWRNNGTVAWACGIYGCQWRKCNIRLAYARSPDDFHARVQIFYMAFRSRRSHGFSRCISSRPRDREINRSKSETHAAHIRISFVDRFDLWKLVSIFFFSAERITLLAARNSNQSVSRTYYSTPPQSLAAQVRCNVERQRDGTESYCWIINKFSLCSS